LPEFNSLFSFKADSTSSTIEMINAISEEGLSLESTYAIRPRELRRFVGARGNFIGAINTLGMFTFKKAVVRHALYSGGFLSRPKIMSFDFSESVMHEIMDSCINSEDKSTFVPFINLKLPKKRVPISTNAEVNKELWKISEDVVARINPKLINLKGRNTGFQDIPYTCQVFCSTRRSQQR